MIILQQAFSAAFYRLCFYASGTLDNLMATSSPVQMVVDDPRPGDKEEVIATNRKAFREICAPLLEKQLGDRAYMYGDTFTAIDIAVGYSLSRTLQKRPAFFEGHDRLREYTERVMARPAYQRAIVP